LLVKGVTGIELMKNLTPLFAFLALTANSFGAGSGSGGATLPAEQGNRTTEIYNQGVSLMRAKRFPEASAKFQQCLTTKPNFAEAHNNLAYSLRKQGPRNYAEALAHYNRAIQLNPNLAEAYEYRGALFVLLGRKAEAEKDLATLKKLKPSLATELAEVIQTGKEEEY
jgi:tetratricopeptide (TPR) repeat protein